MIAVPLLRFCTAPMLHHMAGIEAARMKRQRQKLRYETQRW
jgi:hypothetical protein